MKSEITKAMGNLHVLHCNPMNTSITSLIRQKPGESEFLVRLPGWIAELKSTCEMLFNVEKFYTKCNDNLPVPYPDYTDPTTGNLQPGFRIQLNCSNIRHSVCPYNAISSEPSCSVANIYFKYQTLDNHSNSVNVSVTFDRVLTPKDATLLHYWVRYGEARRINTSDMVRLFSITDDPQFLLLENISHQFILPNLNVRRPYAVQICAMYRDTPPENLTWSRYSQYGINIPDHIAVRDDPSDLPQPASDQHIATYVAAVSVPLILALLIAIAVFTIIMLRYKRAKSIGEFKVRPSGWDDDRYVIMPSKVDKWELERQHLVIYEDQKLGSGAFGSVYKCKVICPLSSRNISRSIFDDPTKDSGEAAVKLLPEYADETSKSDFRQEINLMKNLGYHERLVNMLGCVTATEPLCLIVEYCQEGDLLHYLRDRRNYMIKLEENGIDINNLTEADQVNMDLLLCFKDLLSFAWQISVGLEYLSQKGYIHRDVAARNVLVDKGKRAKIGDFGLCRYSYDDSVYLSHGGRLPIKWMALEAIKNYEFTTKSDVWSYGVLLFEIITMGGNPYPGLQPVDLESYLEAGNRMEQPDNCPEILYAVMLECWRKVPEDRPTFSQLREQMRLLLEEVTYDYSYMNLNQARDYYNILPTDYPTLTGAAIDLQSQTSQTSITSVNSPATVTLEDECPKSLQSIETQSTEISNDSDSQSINDKSDPLRSPSLVTPSAVITGTSHRDSAGSEQLLITPTTPKFKFFKFKPNSKNVLEVLPEANSGSDGTDGCSSGGRSYSNDAYTDDLLPNGSKSDLSA